MTIAFQLLWFGQQEAPFVTDTQDAVYSDSTSLSRVADEGYIIVRSVVRGLAEDWIGPLAMAAGGDRLIKWKSVEQLVTGSHSAEASRVRDRLAEQAVVITDMTAPIRNLDIQIARASNRPIGAFCTRVMAMRGPAIDARQRQVQAELRSLVTAELLDASAVSEIEHLLKYSATLLLGGGGPGVESVAGWRATALAKIRHSTLQLAKFASQSTVLLVAEQDDPRPRFSPTESWFFDYGYSARLLAQERLARLAGQRIVFDKGEENVSGVVEELRRAVALAERDNLLSLDGRVTTGDDAATMQLQVADVVAGYAKWILYTSGAEELAIRFRLVFYNGAVLTPLDGRLIDTEHREYVRLLTGGA